MQILDPTTATARWVPVRGRTERAELGQIVKTVIEESKPIKKTKEIKVSVELRLLASDAKSVAVAGSFNDWNVRKALLKKEGDCWATTLKLPRGRYEYRFVVDGKWVSDPSAKESAPNPFGSSNSVLSV